MSQALSSGTTVTSSAQQWLRAASLVVADESGNGIELAGPTQQQVLRIRFTVAYNVTQTPAIFYARVYNLSPATTQTIQSLASKDGPTLAGMPRPTSARVVFKAGYQSNFGQVFTGGIYQLKIGVERNVDSYLDIFAADGDAAHNFAYLSKSLAKGYTAQDIWTNAGQSMRPQQVTAGPPPDGLSTTPSPRGRVLFGPTASILRDHSEANNYWWNINGGQLQGYPRFSARPGDVILINHDTGQVGVPEQTENGITLQCLLNPAIRWGTQIKLNNTEIAQFALNKPGTTSAVSPNVSFANQGAWIPPLNTDGLYVCVSVEHLGDTRGVEWYSKITALNINPTAPRPQAVPQTAIPPPLSSAG